MGRGKRTEVGGGQGRKKGNTVPGAKVLPGFLLGVSLLSQDLKSRDGAWAPEPPVEICLKPTTPLTHGTWSSARLRAS